MQWGEHAKNAGVVNSVNKAEKTSEINPEGFPFHTLSGSARSMSAGWRQQKPDYMSLWSELVMNH